MTLLLISFIAGVLTVLAPCILPLLPVIVGGSVTDTRSKLKPYIVTASLALSIVIFTLLLKVTTVFIDIPNMFWTMLSGVIILLFALSLLFPASWAKLSHKFSVGRKANVMLGKASQKKSIKGDILLGAALGPVFSSCSPTYFVIIGTVIPQSLSVGLINLFAYVLGLSMILLGIALLGKRFLSKIVSLSDPNGWFKKTLGVVFLLVAILILSGGDKTIEIWLLDRGLVPSVTIEQKLLDSIK